MHLYAAVDDDLSEVSTLSIMCLIQTTHATTNSFRASCCMFLGSVEITEGSKRQTIHSTALIESMRGAIDNSGHHGDAHRLLTAFQDSHVITVIIRYAGM